jgi:hypothetical protein
MRMFLEGLISNNIGPSLCLFRKRKRVHAYYDQFTCTQLKLIEKLKYVYISTTGCYEIMAPGCPSLGDDTGSRSTPTCC